jgi:hypothetical protein
MKRARRQPWYWVFADEFAAINRSYFAPPGGVGSGMQGVPWFFLTLSPGQASEIGACLGESLDRLAIRLHH